MTTRGNETPRLLKNDLKGRLVKDIIDEQGQWKVSCIRENFSEWEARIILDTPISRTSKPNEIIWNLEVKGVSTVKSAYHLASNLASAQEASSSNASSFDPNWRRFWKLNSVPKAKICAWRIIKDSLPTLSNIVKKGIITNSSCFFCAGSLKNRQLICSGIARRLEKVWLRYIPQSKSLFVLDISYWKTEHYWEWLADNLDNDELDKAILILWSIWNHRNANLKE